QGRSRNIGTFRESWQLTWRPELDLALIEASMWGSTVAAAATQRARSIAADAAALDVLTALTEQCLLADLGDALAAVLAAVRDRAALDPDVPHLMTALPARVGADEAGLRMSRALSAAVPVPAAAGWAEGFLAGSGLLLVHDDKLLALADGWLAGLSADAFTAVLPALRRTFGEFAPPERRAIGEQAARLDGRRSRPVAAAATA